MFAEERPELVFHLAAQIDVRVSMARPGFDARTNVEGTVNVLEAAREAGTRRVVFSSTGGAMYGDTDEIPTPETVPPLPMSGYGQSKFCAERYLGLFSRVYGMSTMSLRFGNVYGPRQDPHGEAGVIAIFCGAFYAGGRPKVFGDGAPDARLHLRRRPRRRDRRRGRLRRRGRDQHRHRARDHRARADRGDRRRRRDSPFEPEFAEARLGELERSCLAAGKAREVLGWVPQVDVREGIARTLAAVEPAPS